MGSLFRTQKEALDPSVVEGQVDQLKELLGVDLGLERGIHGFPDDVAAIIEAELYRLSEKRYGPPGPQIALLLEQEADLQKQRQSVEEQRIAYLSRHAAQLPWRELNVASATIRWPSAVASVAVSFALTGLWLESRGGLGWRGWAALALGASLMMLNLRGLLAVFRCLTRLPVWASDKLARYREYLDYRRTLARATALDKCIARVRSRRVAEAERRDVAEEWIARSRELIWGYHAYHKTKGAAAAQLAGE